MQEAIGKAYEIPLDVCVAQSEGEIGYVLEQALRNFMSRQGSARQVVSLLSQVVVDEHNADRLPTNRSVLAVGVHHSSDATDEEWCREIGLRVVSTLRESALRVLARTGGIFISADVHARGTVLRCEFRGSPDSYGPTHNLIAGTDTQQQRCYAGRLENEQPHRNNRTGDTADIENPRVE